MELLPSCPTWISVGQVHTKDDAPLYFSSALASTFFLDDSMTPETVLYTPHGVAAGSLTTIEMVKTTSFGARSPPRSSPCVSSERTSLSWHGKCY